jgi:hypothetical protein
LSFQQCCATAPIALIVAWQDFARGSQDSTLAAAFAGPQSIYFAVGITNSAPLAMLAGQRCMTDFCLV